MQIQVEDRRAFLEAMKQALTIDAAKTALVAVDMHQGHLDPSIGHLLVPDEERVRVLANAERLLRVTRSYKIPLIHVILTLRPAERRKRVNPFTRIANAVQAGLPPGQRSWNGHLHAPDTPWQPKIMPEVAPGPEDFVIDSKKTFSAYYGTDLEILLKTLGVETVVIIGINTNTCDLSSSFDTVNRGYKLVVISDCVASGYGQDLHHFALQNISRCLGWVLTIPEFEAKLALGEPGASGNER